MGGVSNGLSAVVRRRQGVSERDFYAITSAALGAEERLIGGANEFLWRLALAVTEGRDTDAERKVLGCRRCRAHTAQIGDLAERFFGHRERLLVGSSRQYNHELLFAAAAEQIGGAMHGPLQRSPDLFAAVIASLVSGIGVVDSEQVNVPENQRYRCSGTYGALPLPLRFVVGAGQLSVHFFQLLLQPAQSDKRRVALLLSQIAPGMRACPCRQFDLLRQLYQMVGRSLQKMHRS